LIDERVAKPSEQSRAFLTDRIVQRSIGGIKVVDNVGFGEVPYFISKPKKAASPFKVASTERESFVEALTTIKYCPGIDGGTICDRP
jgi:hypothetical protein